MSNIVDYNELDPGIRETVLFLRERGFNTTDSGDGSKAETMECAEAEPNVYMVCEAGDLILQANRLKTVLVSRFGEKIGERARIEANYSPFDGIAILALHGVSDKDFEA